MTRGAGDGAAGDRRIVSWEIETCIQPQQDPGWTNARGGIAALDGLIVTLTDAAGRRGEGHVEAMAFYADSLAGARAAAEEVCPEFVGRDPGETEALLARMNRVLSGHLAVKAGLDCALHELLARQLDLPLNRLFGGRRHDRLPLQRILPLKPPEALAEEARALMGQGYRCLKLKIDGDGDTAVARAAAVRAACGAGMRLSVDANQSYRAKEFLPVLRGLEAAGVDLAEQPVAAHDLSGLRLLRGATDLVIEADEAVTDCADLLRVIAAEACDSVNLKVFRLGGLRNTALAARICEAAGLGYRVGTAFGPRLIAAQSAHLAASLPRVCYPLELAEFEHLLNDPYEGLEVEEGTLPVPGGPGSGLRRRAPEDTQSQGETAS
jgi:L-alanine-DL-glutamate epimerase-like enolase superfamily enzyme